MGNGFTLKAAPLPAVTRGAGKYRAVLDEFIKSGMQSALVQGYEAQPASVSVGLRKLAEREGLPVQVRNVGGNVYLVGTPVKSAE
jgi:hypothetical protein